MEPAEALSRPLFRSRKEFALADLQGEKVVDPTDVPVRPQGPGSGPGAVRRMAARGVWALHVGVAGFLLVGWMLPWAAAWWIYLLLAPIVQVGWIVFDDYCWLSIVEAKLLREPLVKTRSDGSEEARVFVGELIEKLSGVAISNRCSNWISYSILWVGFCVAAIRAFLRAEVG
jgi:hypothetical protein